MAQDIRLDFSGSTTAITITLNSLADGSSVNATGFDLGAQAPAEIGLHLVLDGNSASNTSFVEVAMKWSEEGVSTAMTTDENAIPVGSVLMNGTTVVHGHVVVPVLARYAMPRVTNNSGDSLLSSGNSAEYWPIAVDQA